MPQIIPIRDLRNTTAISDRCHAKPEPLFVTKNGYGDLVVMSIETYDRLINADAIDTEIAEAEQELARGAELKDAKDILPALQRKYPKDR